MSAVRSRDIVIDERIRKALVTLRGLDDPAAPVEDIRADLLTDVEAALGARIPDAVLAAFAAATDELNEDAEMRLENVVELTRSARKKGCPRSLIAVGRDPDGHVHYCVTSAEKAEPEELRLYAFDAEGRSHAAVPFAQWLEARIELRREFLLEGDERERARAGFTPGEADLESFHPRVVAAPQPPREPRRVRHAKFGVGTVARELPGGKLEVIFPNVGTKVVVASFVEDA